MKSGTKKLLMIVAGTALAAVLAYGGYAAWGNLSGARFQPGDEALNSPLALTEWLVRGVTQDRPVKFWNAMTDEYRGGFAKYFDRVRKGEVPVKPWQESAEAAGFSASPDGLAKLSDEDLFTVYWGLKDRGATGIPVPEFVLRDARTADSLGILKVYYNARDPGASSEAFVLYSIDRSADLVHARLVDGRWRLDAPADMPAAF